jgi:hypothetical protein
VICQRFLANECGEQVRARTKQENKCKQEPRSDGEDMFERVPVVFKNIIELPDFFFQMRNMSKCKEVRFNEQVSKQNIMFHMQAGRPRLIGLTVATTRSLCVAGGRTIFCLLILSRTRAPL